MSEESDKRPEGQTPGPEGHRKDAGDAAPGARAEGGGLSVEDLVPGLTDAIEAEEARAIESRLIELEAERDQLKDRLMRALAEAENIRKRADRDARDAATYGATKLARDLLTVYDNLDRALEAADESLRETHPGFLEGIELTRRELINAFAKHRIEKVVPEKGEKFDPNRHQAMFEAPVPGAASGTVIEVMQAGFVIADRLLRPALVGVAKAQAQPESGGAAASGAGDAGDADGTPETSPEPGRDGPEERS